MGGPAPALINLLLAALRGGTRRGCAARDSLFRARQDQRPSDRDASRARRLAEPRRRHRQRHPGRGRGVEDIGRSLGRPRIALLDQVWEVFCLFTSD